MPNVGSNDFKAARGANDFVSGVPLGKNGTTGGPNNDGWKYGIAVYAHNGTDWVEVWNARPQMVSSTVTATSGTVLSFTGTADPNNFQTTASFELREVGGSYTNSNTTTSGLGNNVDGAVGYAVTATVGSTYRNWEVRAKGVNTAGTDYGSVLTLDCRNTTAWADYTNGAEYSYGGDCATKRVASDRTYTKTGCFTYTVAGANYDNADNKCPDKAFPCYEAGVLTENTENPCGTCGYYTTSSTSYTARAVTGPCSNTTVTHPNGACRDLDARVRIYSEPFQVGYGMVNLYWHGYNASTNTTILAWVGPKNTDGCGLFDLPMYRLWYCGTDEDGINSERPYWIEKFACQNQFTNYP
jgi:hypothetical protein